MQVRLPSGVIINGIPEGTSKEEIKRKAIAAGIATEEDFKVQPIQTDEGEMENMEASWQDRLKASAIDMLPELSALGGAASGALLGAQAGSIVPGAGTALGALAGGAIGAFAGGGAGESARQLIEGEEADPLKALETASYEGILDVTGAKAIDIIADTGRLAGKLLPKGDMPVDIEDVKELQQALRARGSTLRATQARPEDAFREGLESAAEGGLGTKQRFKMIADSQQAYIDDQIDALVKTQSSLSTEQTGRLLQNLIENTRVASSEAFQRTFDELDAAGKGVTINIQGIRNVVTRGRAESMEGLTKNAERIAKAGGQIPFLEGTIKKAYDDIMSLTPNMKFSTAFSKLKNLKKRLTALRGDPATKNDPAVAELASIVNNFETKMLAQAQKTSPELVEMYTKAMKQYSQAQDTLYNNTMKAALKDDPELVARHLLSYGRVTPIKDIRNLVKEAKKLKSTTGRDVLAGLRRSFMEKALAGEGGQGINQLLNLEKRLGDPDFLRTYEELYDAQTVAKVNKLIKQANILSRGPGGELALSIRSRQATAAESVIRPDRTLAQRFSAVVIANMPRIIAKNITDPASIDRLSNIVKVVIKAENEGKRIPAAAVRGLLVMAGDAGIDIEDDRRIAEVNALRKQYGLDPVEPAKPRQAAQPEEPVLTQEELLRQEAGL